MSITPTNSTPIIPALIPPLKLDQSKCLRTPSFYHLRATTCLKRESPLDSITPKKRKILEEDETPSSERSPGHNCNQVDPNATLLKVNERIVFSWQRFAISYLWNCETRRGRTQINGGRAHCGGCQAGHAALTPTLYDNMLNNVVCEIEKKEFRHINEISQLYFCHRFTLDPTSSELKNLDDSDSNIRKEQLTEIVSRLQEREKKGSFANSDFEKIRNSTFINPTGCNRFDSHIENLLKPFEDELCKACTDGTTTPSDALAKICEKYDHLLTTALTNLEEALTRFTDLQTCWETLIDTEKKLLEAKKDAPKYEACFDELLKAIKDYKIVFDQQFDKKNKKPGVPSLKNFHTFLRSLQSPYVLNHILEERSKNGVEAALQFYKANSLHLKQPQIGTETKFEEAQNEIIIRRNEAQIQLNALRQISEKIEEIPKRIFGVKNDKGEFITPKKDQIAQQLIEIMGTTTPTRSDLPKRKLPRKLTFSEAKIDS